MDNKQYEKNCSTCRHEGLFSCETLVEHYHQIAEKSGIDTETCGTLKRFELMNKAKKSLCCEKYSCKYIQYPIDVSGIDASIDTSRYHTSNSGKFVNIRLADESNKSYLGLYVGDLPHANMISHHPETKKLSITPVSNPAIFVFELNRIVFGYESWWQVIETPDDVKEISDDMIQNQWYVKMLNEIMSDGEREEKKQIGEA